jgi:acyl-CoA thioesterase FadM
MSTSVVRAVAIRATGLPRVSAVCDLLRPVLLEDVVDIELRVKRGGS